MRTKSISSSYSCEFRRTLQSGHAPIISSIGLSDPRSIHDQCRYVNIAHNFLALAKDQRLIICASISVYFSKTLVLCRLLNVLSNSSQYDRYIISTLSERERLFGFVIANTLVSATTDLGISGTLIYLLQRSRTGFRINEQMIFRLTLFTMQTTLATTVCAVCGALTVRRSSKPVYRHR